MLRKCYMVIAPNGYETVFLEAARSNAEAYATKQHGELITMYGQCSMPPEDLIEPVIPQPPPHNSPDWV